MGFSFSDVISPLNSIVDALQPDMSGAINAAGFNPVNVQGLFGGLTYDKGSRTFTSSMDPRITALQGDLFRRLGQLNPQTEYQMMRQMAAPGFEQERLGMESRLFSQGLLGADKEYKTGGAFRGLLDSQQQRDMMMQQQAIANSRAERVNLLNQLLGLGGLEQNLFGASGMMSGYAGQAGQAQAGLMAQDAAFLPNQLWNLAGNAVQGYTAGG